MSTLDLFNYEAHYGDIVAGCDEVGRGPLAGPVTVAACIMPHGFFIEGINDSKKLSEKKREQLFEKIIKVAKYEVCSIEPKVIDQINILEATKLAMKTVTSKLNAPLTLVDAVKLDIPQKTVSIIKGDATSYSIAAASIIAKVIRDRLMREYDELYPQYGFADNKGYGTSAHILALKTYGETPIHRKSFIKNFI